MLGMVGDVRRDWAKALCSDDGDENAEVEKLDVTDSMRQTRLLILSPAQQP